MAPWAAIVQSDGLEPWALQAHKRKHGVSLRRAVTLVRRLREFTRVVGLLCQHTTTEERRHLMRAAFYAAPADFFQAEVEDEEISRQPWGEAVSCVNVGAPWPLGRGEPHIPEG